MRPEIADDVVHDEQEHVLVRGTGAASAARTWGPLQVERAPGLRLDRPREPVVFREPVTSVHPQRQRPARVRSLHGLSIHLCEGRAQ